MAKVKDNRRYTVDNLTSSEVKAIGVSRWMRKIKFLYQLIVMSAFAIALIMFIVNNVVTIIFDITFFVWIIVMSIKSTKAEKRFLKEIQEKNDGIV